MAPGVAFGTAGEGWLRVCYAQSAPLALAATLAFEQSYDEVEGDSASLAELLASLQCPPDNPYFSKQVQSALAACSGDLSLSARER